MTIYELKNILTDLNIPKEYYSLLDGGLPNERLCLTYDGAWSVYYSERGEKTGLRVFISEDEACEYFLRKIKRYAAANA